MIVKSSGVRPQGKTLFISRHRGFTLVEIMMSIVLLALGLALALPSYRDMVEKRQREMLFVIIGVIVSVVCAIVIVTKLIMTRLLEGTLDKMNKRWTRTILPYGLSRSWMPR